MPLYHLLLFRIYVIVGDSDTHLGLLEAMVKEEMLDDLDEAEYFVIGIRDNVWDPERKM